MPCCDTGLGELDYAAHKHDNAEASSEYSDALSVHRSPDLIWEISPKRKDMYRLVLYSTCDKEIVAKGSVQYADELQGNLSKCVQCQFGKQPSTVAFRQRPLRLMNSLLVLAYNKPATICLKGNCQYCIYCASCTEARSEARRIDHRHKNSMYVVTLLRRRELPIQQVRCKKCQKSKSSQLLLPHQSLHP
jgi:hypothetical protein